MDLTTLAATITALGVVFGAIFAATSLLSMSIFIPTISARESSSQKPFPKISEKVFPIFTSVRFLQEVPEEFHFPELFSKFHLF